MIHAYAAYVKNLPGWPARFTRPTADDAASLIKKMGGVDKAPLEALAWLMPLLFPKLAGPGFLCVRAVTLGCTAGERPKHTDMRAAIVKLLMSNIEETAAHAHFVSASLDRGHMILHSVRIGSRFCFLRRALF